MKPSIVFVSCFLFAVTQVTTADDLLPRKSAPQRVARPVAGIHSPVVKAGVNQPVGQRNPNVRRNDSFARPIQRGALAMNVQNSIKYGRTRQEPELLQQGQKVNPAPGTFQTTIHNRVSDNRQSYFEALKRCHRERHDRNWWRQRCKNIVFVRTGYYYLDAGYWYPAYGYDPAYDYYDYDGPIYTYGDLLPDQVIANVQRALQEAGYYAGPVTGSLNPGTRAALANYQRDYGLIVTGAIDEPTVASLELY